jgi:hypothetical protein
VSALQITNGISFLFSLFGTSFVIQRFGLAKTLLAFPTIVTLCVISVYLFPNLWVVFSVMMVRAHFPHHSQPLPSPFHSLRHNTL